MAAGFKVWFYDPKGRKHFSDLGVYGRVILKNGSSRNGMERHGLD